MIFEKLITYKTPAQIIYIGNSYVDIYRISNKKYKKIVRINDFSVNDIDEIDFGIIKRELLNINTGLVINSQYFTYNILRFDNVPFKKRLLNELVVWRLNNLFPNNIDNYIFHYYRVDKHRIFVILIQKNFIKKIIKLFSINKVNLNYIGSSLIEIFDNLYYKGIYLNLKILIRKKNDIRFLIEMDKNSVMMVFFKNFVPVFLRKIFESDITTVKNEVIRTINFVHNNHKIFSESYNIISTETGYNEKYIKENISKIGIKENRNRTDLSFLPVKK